MAKLKLIKKECDGSGTIIDESMHPILGPQFYPKKCNGCKKCKKENLS